MEDEESFAKQQLRQPGGRDGSLLGLSWDKGVGEITVVVPRENVITCKRGIVRKLAKIYDPLGLAAPLTLKDKLIYRDACKAKLAWDAPLSSQLAGRWSCPERERATTKGDNNKSLDTSAGRDRGNRVPRLRRCKRKWRVRDRTCSGEAEIRCEHRIRCSESTTSQTRHTIPRLELVLAYMATNLINNARWALVGFPVKQPFGWLDSTVALHWVKGGGE